MEAGEERPGLPGPAGRRAELRGGCPAAEGWMPAGGPAARPRQKFRRSGRSRPPPAVSAGRAPGPAELRRSPLARPAAPALGAGAHIWGNPLPGLPPDVSAAGSPPSPGCPRAGSAARHRAVAAAEGPRHRHPGSRGMPERRGRARSSGQPAAAPRGRGRGRGSWSGTAQVMANPHCRAESYR